MHITDEQYRAARAIAQWEIGDSSWADVIIGALKNPAATMEYLAEERKEAV